jgi:hypothetical protein
MSVFIPQNWFDSEQHDLHRIAWYLYEYQEYLDTTFLDGLVNLLKDVEGDFIEIHYKNPHDLAEPHVLAGQAEDNILKRFKESEQKRRAKLDPIFRVIEESKPLPNSVYDYVNAEEYIKMVEIEVKKLQLLEKKKSKGKAKEPAPKKKKKKKVEKV